MSPLTVRTNRDLYLRLAALGADVTESGRALLDYLCALWTVTRPLAEQDTLAPDDLLAMLAAAANAQPVRPDPAWRVADLTVDGEYRGFGDFTKVLCTQIADLLAFEEHPPGPYAGLGVPAPPRWDGGRATVGEWYNFDVAIFLECAAAGAFGGWHVADGHRVAERDAAVVELAPLSWGDVAAFLEYGQSFE